MYQIVPNKLLSNNAVTMTCDENFHKRMAPGLPNQTFCWLFTGAPGVGKTSALISLFTGKPIGKVRVGYYKIFEHIIVCSPSLHTIRNNPFKDLPEEQMHLEFNMKLLNYVENFTNQSAEEEERTVLILDDVGSQLKSSQALSRKLAFLIQTRRHRQLSIFILVQKFRDIPLNVRSAITHLSFWRPVNQKELLAIHEELLPIPKEKLLEFIKFVFSKAHTFLYIDLSLKYSAQYIFYRNFDRIIFDNNTKDEKEGFN